MGYSSGEFQGSDADLVINFRRSENNAKLYNKSDRIDACLQLFTDHWFANGFTKIASDPIFDRSHPFDQGDLVLTLKLARLGSPFDTQLG
jgi:hypothetical protein